VSQSSEERRDQLSDEPGDRDRDSQSSTIESGYESQSREPTDGNRAANANNWKREDQRASHVANLVHAFENKSFDCEVSLPKLIGD